MRPFLATLLNLVLGHEKAQRAGLALTFTAIGIYTFSLLLQAVNVRLGFVDEREALALTLLIAAAQVAFYVLIRSGWSRRFGDASLVMPQMAFGLVALALAYLIDAHVRGMLLMLVALVLSYGSFTLSPRGCRGMGLFAVLLLGAVMAFAAVHDPARFHPVIEAQHFAFAAVVLPTIGYLAGVLSKLRLDLRRQRQELRDALERLNRLATIDELTGLPNRRCLLEHVPHELARCRRESQALTVALIDLDHFKRINDTLGHAAGDAVLRRFAVDAQQVLRTSDTMARWGGEEFLVLMPDCTVPEACAVLERLRRHLARRGDGSASPAPAVTFSAGVAELGRHEDLTTTLRRADEALYAAKARGRDCVETA
ncbi:MAG: GGDEF domain-containing protein [Piscinibacter sp.]|nr:GGDEF domain-containing protein [Piscinibacter sp.]